MKVSVRFFLGVAVCSMFFLVSGKSFSDGPVRESFARPSEIPHPENNEWTKAREILGRTLFFDPRLSGTETMSCATCHKPEYDFSDTRGLSLGDNGRGLHRRTPTLINLAWGKTFFWDGRAESLEEQALGPIKSPDEMNLTLTEMLKRIQSIPAYEQLFREAYPGDAVGESVVARALALYQRTLVSAEAPFDRWVQGDDEAISAAARRGFDVFVGKARCAACHSGWRFTDESFHDIGVPGTDRGRGEILKGIEAVEYAFKTPTLRNISRRGPYMHDGSISSLDAVIRLYMKGGAVDRPSLSAEIEPIALDEQEVEDLIAFLETLTSVDPPAAIPHLPR